MLRLVRFLFLFRLVAVCILNLQGLRNLLKSSFDGLERVLHRQGRPTKVLRRLFVIVGVLLKVLLELFDFVKLIALLILGQQFDVIVLAVGFPVGVLGCCNLGAVTQSAAIDDGRLQIASDLRCFFLQNLVELGTIFRNVIRFDAFRIGNFRVSFFVVLGIFFGLLLLRQGLVQCVLDDKVREVAIRILVAVRSLRHFEVVLCMSEYVISFYSTQEPFGELRKRLTAHKIP